MKPEPDVFALIREVLGERTPLMLRELVTAVRKKDPRVKQDQVQAAWWQMYTVEPPELEKVGERFRLAPARRNGRK